MDWLKITPSTPIVTGICSKCDPVNNEPADYGICKQCSAPMAVACVNLKSLGAMMDLVNAKIWHQMKQ